MKKVLVTGGAGFIGYHLAVRLSERYDIYIVDNLLRGRMDYDFKELISKPNVKFIDGDLTDPSFFQSLSKDFDYIYHLAAVIGVRKVENNPDEVLSVNAVSTLNLFEFAKKLNNLKKIFFSSTSEIYAGTQKHFGINVPTDEEVLLTIAGISSRRSTYMLSKMYGESICFNYGSKYSIPFTIGRYHNVYGPRMGFMHVVPETFLKIKSSNEIEVPSPNHTRAMCYIDDAVEMTILSCESENTEGHIMNIGNQKQEIKIKDLVTTIAKTLNKEIDIKEMPATLGSPERRCPDMGKMTKMFDFKPKVSLKEGIRKTYAWYKDKLDQPYE